MADAMNAWRNWMFYLERGLSQAAAPANARAGWKVSL
jgi:hypothetical protein